MATHTLVEIKPYSHIYVADNVLNAEFCIDVISRFEAASEEQ